jgi:hypothetical protein
VEKFLFIRLYRIPPHFSNVVGVFATSLVPYALVIHLGMLIWVLSDKTIFDSGSGVTVILAVLLVLLAMSVVAAWIFSVFSKQIMKVPTYLPKLPTYLSTYLPTGLHIYLPTYLSTYLSIYLPADLVSYSFRYMIDTADAHPHVSLISLTTMHVL